MTMPTTDTVHVRLFGRTDVGQIREHNEDNFLVADLTRGTRGLREADRDHIIGGRGTVLGVCDGMGGAAAGEVASQMAVDIIHEQLAEGDVPTSRDDLARRLVHAVEEAGTRIFREARIDRSRRGMGTTSTVAALLDGRLFLAQVGDSRAYILREGKLTQVTRDQSLVNQLIEAGQLTEEEAETFEHNNIILQALGTAETVQVDLTFVDLAKGDRLLLCSDGLSGMIKAEEIREALATNAEPVDACRMLTERANAAGGHDNITVIIADFDGESLPLPADAPPAVYRKYALPELGSQPGADETVRAPALATTSPNAPASNQLRIGQTMVGQAYPIPEPPRSVAPRFQQDDPVDIPKEGLSPAAMVAIGLGTLTVLLLAAAAAVVFLVRW